MSDRPAGPVCVFGAGAVGCYLGGRLAAGRATEVDWINGEIVRLAGRFGAPAPVNARLGALVHDAARAAARPAWRGDALWADLSARAPRVGHVRAA